jgi:hypothetical protein
VRLIAYEYNTWERRTSSICALSLYSQNDYSRYIARIHRREQVCDEASILDPPLEQSMGEHTGGAKWAIDPPQFFKLSYTYIKIYCKIKNFKLYVDQNSE